MTNHHFIAFAAIFSSVSLFSCLPETGANTQVTAPDDLPVHTAAVTTTVSAENGVQFSASSEYATHLAGNDDAVYLVLTAQAGTINTDVQRSPLNISLVIDRSGSMQSEDKLNFVKQACQTVVQNLGNNDQVSVVSYDSYVNVVSESGKVTDKDKLMRQIGRLRSGGSTNLSGGMLEGYAQTKSTLASEQVNRVLLLSDGLANQGITSPSELNKIGQTKFQEEGIGLSTFGVGLNFNEDLMASLAESGAGNYYFIESADQIPVIFAKELDGLLSVIAQNSTLNITFPENSLTFERAFGYQASVTGNKVQVRFNDIFAEEEKTVVLKFSKKELNETADFNFSCALQFDDVQGNYQRMVLEQDLKISIASNLSAYQESRNPEATRECMLFEANDRMEMAIKAVDGGEYDDARAHADAGIIYLQTGIEKHGSNDELQVQLTNFKTYRTELNDIEARTEMEMKYIQKCNKSLNYSVRKKK